MRRVYLDQNKWIELARAAAGKDGAALDDLLLLARHGVAAGLLSLPLSCFHYMETWRKQAWSQRGTLARFMAELSRFDTIAPADLLLRMELDLALRERFGQPRHIRAVDIFGRGVAHAFGRLGPRFPVSDELRALLAQHPDLRPSLEEEWELAALAGPPEDLPVPRLRTGTERVHGKRFAAGQRENGERLREAGFGRGRLPRALIAQELVAILDPLSEAMGRAGLSADQLAGADTLTDFLLALPTRRMNYQLVRVRHRNPQQRWEENDLNDIAALSVVVPYCDIVVTERHWRGLIRDAHLDEAYGTIVLDDLRDLAPAILSLPR